MMDENNSSEAISQPPTLVELLRARASHLPDRQAYLYLVDGEEEGASLTFAELDQRARSFAAWLQQEGIVGGHVLLLYPPGLDFIAAFFGCLYAGVVAVPVYPPRLNRPSPRIQAIATDAQVTVAITTTKIYRGLQRRFDLMPELAALRWLNSEELPGDLSGLWQEPRIRSDNLALLQYTSGSTGSPKGVMLSHRNLMHNLRIINHGFQMEHESTGAFWLPSYHDMGLIGGILAPMYVKGRAVLMAPAAFLQRPIRWLEAISRYRAGISGAPNFAYQMCIDKISPEQREALDLSCWNIAFCGAEPIRLETLDRFADTFAAQGFRRESFYPCYGLAESTLMVSGGAGPSAPTATSFDAQALREKRGVRAAAETQDGITLVGCGQALLEQQVVIVDPKRLTACAPGEIGEIWTAGPSVAEGYWQQPELTKEIFHANLVPAKAGMAGGEGERFLRTGDLGFVYEGELYIAGRLKDLIIIHGRNHYPQDIEHTAGQCHEALEAGMSAAFTVMEDGEEKLVLVHEVTRRQRKPDLEPVVTAVRRAIAHEHQLQVQAVVLIKPLSIPRTSSGKVQRHACKEGYLDGFLQVVGEWQAGSGPGPRAAKPAPSLPKGGSPLAAQPAAELARWLVGQIATELAISPEKIDIQAPFVDYGLDSVKAVSIAGEIERQLGRSLSPTLLWDYPTIAALSAHLAETAVGAVMVPDPAGVGAVREPPVQDPPVQDPPVQDPPVQEGAPIAVIGLSCRFPGAAGAEEFWQLLQEGVDAVQEVPAARWDLERFYGDEDEPLPGKMNTRWGGFLGQVDGFDAAFFGISPREAARLDPQQRLLLEVAWEALERAGQNPALLAGSATGVFVGISSSDYARLQFSDPELIDAYAGTGNAHSVAANRLSYFLDLRGPSMAVDTACSSSLVATHLGMMSLRSGEVDLALVGGVNVLLAPDLTIAFSQAHMMAADGRCKSFDARADGYVRGEGCGVLVLKRLADAQRDGDPVLAVLRGSAVNQDGRSNGLTAPNGLAQQAVIRGALADAGVAAADIGYIEAHGTGTRLGDPIEVQALQAVLDEASETEVLAAEGTAQGAVPVGSVKTNIGHLEAAAGAAGLIKTILALVHERIPPLLHFEVLNPHIRLEGSRLAIGGAGREWRRGDRPRLAGVSSFGFGGTNAHIVVQEALIESEEWRGAGGELGVESGEGRVELLTLSAMDERGLGELAGRYAAVLEENPALRLADVCYTANTGRARFGRRLAIVAEGREELRRGLAAFRPRPAAGGSPGKVAFLFTGQGAQYEGMGRLLYESEPVFRAALDRCTAVLDGMVDGAVLERAVREPPLQRVIYPEVPATGDGRRAVDETTYTQPALFAVEFALAELWRSWGVVPDVVMGHSVGEFVAAVVAGVMSLEDGLRLVAARGRLMGALPAGGGMAAIFAAEARVREALADFEGQVFIAGENGPNHVVVSGRGTAVTAVVERLAAEGIGYRYLAVSHAFHSPLMDPMLDGFVALALQVVFAAPRIPLVSNLTGEWLSEAPDASAADASAADAGYWREHARRPVLFWRGLQTVAESGVTIFLEVGPQPHLTGMGRRCLAGTAVGDEAIWLFSLKKGRNDRRLMLESLGSLFAAGVDVDLRGFYGQARGRKLVLPTYPFQRERHWMERSAAGSERRAASGDKGLASGGWRAAGAAGVRRLAVPVPIFEAALLLSDPVRNGAVLRETVLAVADLFWGRGGHDMEGVAVSERFTAAAGEFVTQTMVNVGGVDTAVFQMFVYDDAAGAWELLAGGRMRRGSDRQPAAGDSQLLSGSGALTRQGLLAEEEEERPALVSGYLRAQAAGVLGLEVERLDLERPLDGLGMDSLMALELKSRIEKDLGVDLPLVRLLQGPSVRELAQVLLDYVLFGQAEREAAARIEASAAEASATEALTLPGEAAPLSYDQQAMWLLHELLPAETSFNVSGAARVRGEIDSRALGAALQRVVARHAALRTTFAVEKGGPVQIVQDTAAVNLLEIEGAGWDEAALQSFLEVEAQRPFKLDVGPLLRLILVKREAEEAVLLLSLNHLITDFWSMSLLVHELLLFYTAERGGEPVSLPPVALLPADYARRQAEMLDGPEGEAHRQYWLQKLDGELPRLDLPTDRPRPAVLNFDGDAASRLFNETMTADLKAFSREQGTTLATTLLAAFQTLLYRTAGQEDLLVGSVIAGRERPELQDMVGYFVNPVALRADFSGGPAFVEFLAQTKQTMFEAMEHQRYPLSRLAEELAAGGKRHLDPSRPPLFETMFIMQRAQLTADQGLAAFALGIPGTRIELYEGGSRIEENSQRITANSQQSKDNGQQPTISADKGGGGARASRVTVEPMALGRQPTQFDLTLMMAEVNGGLAASLHYNTKLFDKGTAERLLQHLESLLQGITATQGRESVAALRLVVGEEREKLLRSWNETERAYESGKTLPELVSEQAARTPESIAVTFDGAHLTYAELERRAGQLAYYLQDLGVGPETLVALFVERSLDMVTGLLGILKAGGVYIPLDPDFPPSRISLMLEDAQPAVILTQEKLTVNNLQPTADSQQGRVVCLDSEWPVIAEAAARELVSAGPDNLAYVIYTSGSSGKPKGVQIPHRAAVNFLQSMQHEPGLAAGDHLLAVTTLSFDIALLELFLPLICGAQVTIAGRETAVDGVRLQELLESAKITLMQGTPATWRLLLEAGWSGKDDLKVLCGGEALPLDLAERLMPRCASLWNMYGPTETTVWSTLCRITEATKTISIGRPIANTRIYILDKEMQPVPTGVVGDLYIAGDGLARGYLNRPQLTAERFVPDPFGAETAKMYKTGDLARYMADGNILFLGRDDFQVKIRGYRIELGDIETAVGQHPAVAQNVCVAHEASSGAAHMERRLVSYIVPQAGERLPATAGLRAYLRAQLPDYMIPAHFIFLEALPLLPNGKINRSALPVPEGGPRTGATYVAPRSELETRVARLSASILNLEKVSIHDSFFDLGGNSLLATRLIFQTRELFGVQIPLRQLFMQPTVAGLSLAIEAAQQTANGHSSTGSAAAGGQQPFLDKMTLGELQTEVRLDPAIRAAGLPQAQTGDPRHVLLTGATGFVGAFLLRDLLHDTGADVYCLVRAADPRAGLERVRQNMAAYGLWDETFAARIVPVPGDLGRPQFGLTDGQFQDLARQIEMIVHNGALVNFIYSYREHKASNVLGTEEVLRLASQERLKTVHFVSTLSIFHTGEHNNGPVFDEDADLDDIGVPFGGYAQSKWVGEKLVLLAAERGIPVAIYRPGLVAGDSRSGVWNTADMMSTMTRACMAMGVVPELDVDVDIVPVDYVSKALVTLALKRDARGEENSQQITDSSQQPTIGGIFNLSNPRTMAYGELIALVNESGLPLRQLPFERWRQLLVDMVDGLGGDWNPFLPLLEEVTVEQIFMPAFDNGRTLEGLAGTGVSCPAVGPELLQTYLGFLRSSGLVVK